MNILHATYVQNMLDAFHKEFPAFTFGLTQVEDSFFILIPRDFDSIPVLERVAIAAALKEMLQRMRDAGIKAYLDVTDVV